VAKQSLTNTRAQRTNNKKNSEKKHKHRKNSHQQHRQQQVARGGQHAQPTNLRTQHQLNLQKDNTSPCLHQGDNDIYNNNNVIMNWLFVHLLSSYDWDNVILIDLSRFCSILFLSFFGFATSGSLSNFIMNGWTWSKQASSSVQSSLKLIINKT